MKYAEYTIENNKVEFFNTVFGKERVLLNGNVISEKHSFSGTDHYFRIGNVNYSIRPICSLKALGSISFKLHKNGLPVDFKNMVNHKTGTFPMHKIIKAILLAFAGVATGYLFAQYLIH